MAMGNTGITLLVFLSFLLTCNALRATPFSSSPPSTSPSPSPSTFPPSSPSPSPYIENDIPLAPSPASSPLSPASSPPPPPTPPPPSPPPVDGICDAQRYASIGLNVESLTFCDKSLPYDVRAKDLIDSMTLEEKIRQLGNEAYGVPRLGIPKYNWWSEALHGVSDVGGGTTFDNNSVAGATSFPTVILTAASFNESLWKTIGQAVSSEARAMYNLGAAGLTFWSPNINVVRDPRWGRTQETPGEDPFVVGTYAVNYVRGLQDVEGYENPPDLNSRPLKVAACCKHYAAYDVDDWMGVDRFTFSANVTEQDMVETFLAPFEMCVKEGDVSSVMCSYNRVNGIPTCADPKLLKQTIRDDWGLHGYIVSDCDSVELIYKPQHWLDDSKEDAVAQGFKAGLDLDCGMYYTNFSKSAVTQGKLRERDIDRALKNLYVVQMRLGFFDGNPSLSSLGKKDVCSTEHIELATEAAREGIVLLKNENNTLPLCSTKYRTIAVVGPHANATDAMIGNYAGVPCRYTSPLDAFKDAGDVIFEPGCLDVACRNETRIFKAMQAAKKADATIIFAGLDLSIEAESLDRVNLKLPGYQTQLINQTAMVAKGPVILVLLNAGGVDVRFADGNPNIASIIWAGYPGQEGGKAIADVVFGKYNPGGRLPVTWYEENYVNELPMTSMKLRPDEDFGYPGRTYKFFDGSTVYPFGYGISYTTFNYTIPPSDRAIQVQLDQHTYCRDLNYTEAAYRPPCSSVLVNDITCNEEFSFDVQVLNNGSYDGNHVVMVYSKPPLDIVGAPNKRLIGFKRVSIPANETETVSFKFNVCKSLSIVDYTAYNVLPSGAHSIIVDNGLDPTVFPLHVHFHKDQEYI